MPHVRPARFIFALLISMFLMDATIDNDFASGHAFIPSAHAEDDDDHSKHERARLELFDGLPALRLSPARRQSSGLLVQPLQAATQVREARAYGQVLDLQPLVQLRGSYHTAKSDQALAEAALLASQKQYERSRILQSEGGNVSVRKLQEAEAALAADKARLSGATQRQQRLREEGLLHWGETLVNWALDLNSRIFDRLVRRDDVLILLSLDAQSRLPESTSFVYAGRSADRAAARKAYRISPAPQTDPVAQGETYFFRTAAEDLRTGMRLDAWIPIVTESEAGVEVPLTAVVWYANQPWAYIEVEPGLFTRRNLTSHRSADQAWFVSSTLKPGDRIVTRGAQMLLSEEFRQQIPAEDRD